MTELTAKTIHAVSRSRWPFALSMLILAHAAINLFVNPLGLPVTQISESLALPLMGVIIAQPVFFAIWGAFAPGSAPVRIPLALVAFTAVFFAGIPKRWNLFGKNPSSAGEIGQRLLMMLGFVSKGRARLLPSRRIAWKHGSAGASPSQNYL